MSKNMGIFRHMTWDIIEGDCLEVMKSFPENHFSCIVTDPPYGLHFMGKDWDSYAKGKVKVGRKILGTHTNSEAHEAARYDGRREDEFERFMLGTATETLRILKPGGHVLMFGAPRRYHRQVCALEDAGFEIRDCIMWVFGSGFPKSHNRFGISGFGTSLKPSYEPIIMAMKPLDGTFAQNAEKWGLAGINIDGCRIPTAEDRSRPIGPQNKANTYCKGWAGGITVSNPKGRWPANIMFDEEAAKMLDEQSGQLKSGSLRAAKTPKRNAVYGKYNQANINEFAPNSGGASRFFYCAKTSSRERNEGLEGFPLGDPPDSARSNPAEGRQSALGKPRQNSHPTVKPLSLMEYLIKLVMPPQNGLLLDPFAGSGSTILAAKRLGFDAIGIEKQPEYAEIARARVNSYKDENDTQMDMFEKTEG